MNGPTCYVCENPIRGKAVGIGQGLFRHPSKCRPGSKAWLAWVKRTGYKTLVSAKAWRAGA